LSTKSIPDVNYSLHNMMAWITRILEYTLSDFMTKRKILPHI